MTAASLELARGDRVSRFLFSKSQFVATRERVRPSAFDPSPHVELSVGHTSALDDGKVWDMGEAVRRLAGRTAVLARADLDVSVIIDQKLKAIRDDAGFEGHTNVKGWPQLPDEAAQKRAWKGITVALATNAKLLLREHGEG